MLLHKPVNTESFHGHWYDFPNVRSCYKFEVNMSHATLFHSHLKVCIPIERLFTTQGNLGVLGLIS